MQIKKLEEKPIIKKGRPFKYLWQYMDVGDGFSLNRKPGETNAQAVNRMKTLVSHTNKRLAPKVFKVSREEMIVWRDK